MTEDTKSFSRFIWADKVALGFAVLSGLILAGAWSLAFLVIGEEGAKYLWLHLGIEATYVTLLGLMLVWLVLRAVDFAAGGVTYRLVAQNALAVEARIVKAGHAIARLAHLHGPQAAR